MNDPVETVLRALPQDEAGNIDSRQAMLTLGEAVGCVIAFQQADRRGQFLDILRLHALGVAAMRDADK